MSNSAPMFFICAVCPNLKKMSGFWHLPFLEGDRYYIYRAWGA
jgi:hypothetical protein